MSSAPRRTKTGRPQDRPGAEGIHTAASGSVTEIARNAQSHDPEGRVVPKCETFSYKGRPFADVRGDSFRRKICRDVSASRSSVPALRGWANAVEGLGSCTRGSRELERSEGAWGAGSDYGTAGSVGPGPSSRG